MATRTVTNLTAILQMNNTKFKKGIKGSGKAMTGLQKQMVAMKGVIAATFAIGAITNFTRSAFQALDTQRKAEAALLTALKGRADVQQELIKQAQALQKLTLFGDEETIMAQSMIAAFVRTEETLIKVTPLVQDMATALGMDLVGAASLVAKTLGSSTNALTRYGITVTGAVGSSERLTSLVDGLTTAFEGQSIAAAEADVSLTQLKNKWGDFKEVVAGVIVELGPAMKDFLNVMQEDKIRTWDKFLSLFDPQRAIIMTSVAQAMDDVAKAEAKLKAPTDAGRALRSRFSGIEDLNRQMREAREAKAALMATVKTPDALEGLTKFESGTILGFADNLSFDKLPNINSGLATMLDLSKDLDETWDEWAEIMGEDMQTTFFPTLEGMQQETMKLGEMVGVMLVNQFDELGSAIGRTLMGAEGALQDLGESILANLGNILMMVGLQSGNIPLIIAGAGIQLGSGLLRGMGSSTPDAIRTNTGGANVNFRISGSDLVGTLDRQAYQNDINT